MLPTAKSVTHAIGTFDSYLAGYRFGDPLVAEDEGTIVGGLLWGEPYEPIGLDLRFGARIAVAAGTYVQPSHRGRGIARELGLEARRRLRALGFDAVIGGWNMHNERVGKKLFGDGEPYLVSVAVRL